MNGTANGTANGTISREALGGHAPPRTDREDLRRYLRASDEIASTKHELEELEHSDGVELFGKQLTVLQRRLAQHPRAFRQMFIAEGTHAIAWSSSRAN
jgi:glutamate synthase (NADPH/NADH) small chain